MAVGLECRCPLHVPHPEAKSVAAEHCHLDPLEPRDDPDHGVAPESLLQGRAGLEVTVVQIGVRGLPAHGPADLHLQHVLQAFHHLYQGSADVGLLVQEDVVGVVVELLHTVSGRFEDSGIVSVYWFGGSWLDIQVGVLGTEIWGGPAGVHREAAEGEQYGRPHGKGSAGLHGRWRVAPCAPKGGQAVCSSGRAASC